MNLYLILTLVFNFNCLNVLWIRNLFYFKLILSKFFIKCVQFINKHVFTYPINKSLKYSFSAGLLLAFTILVQIVSGVILSCFYISSANEAKQSISYIVNEVNNGYLVQCIHVVFASIIFILLYIHFFKAIFYNMCRWENRVTWWSGLCLLYLIIVEAFTGYILPWGQMSFWGATVITNLFSVVPFIGDYLIKFIWGGSIVGSLTLERFFMLHYLIPSFICTFIFLHLTSLHKLGSTNINNYSVQLDLNFVQLYPYFLLKDIFILLLTLTVGLYLVVYHPYIFDNLVNNIEANSKITPKHIVPEWYFLSFYIILKLILIKWLGIIIMFIFILYPVFLPWVNKN